MCIAVRHPKPAWLFLFNSVWDRSHKTLLIFYHRKDSYCDIWYLGTDELIIYVSFYEVFELIFLYYKWFLCLFFWIYIRMGSVFYNHLYKCIVLSISVNGYGKVLCVYSFKNNRGLKSWLGKENKCGLPIVWVKEKQKD